VNSRLRVVLATAVAPASWGTTYLTTTEFLPAHRPLLAAFARALPFGAVMVLAAGRPPEGAWGPRTVVLGLVNVAVFPALLFVAAYRVPGAVTATVIAIQPIVVLALGAWLLHQRPTRRAYATALVALLGVGLLVSASRVVLDATGLLAAFGAALAMGTGIILQKRWGPPPPILRFTAWQLLWGGLALLPVLLVLEGLPSRLSAENVGGYAYQAIILTGFSYAVWFRGIGRLTPAAVSFLGLLSPLVATMLGWLVLDQSLTVVQLLGALLVAGAIIAAQARTGNRRGDAGARGQRAASASSGQNSG
jgi:probable blue pigment (indigoidine) exporter